MGIRVNERDTKRAGEAAYGILKLVLGDPIVGPTTMQRERFAREWAPHLMQDFQKLLRRGLERDEAANMVQDEYYDLIESAVSTSANFSPGFPTGLR